MRMLQWLMIFLQQISTVKEAFIDISLPIIEERVSCLNQMILENKVYQAGDCCIHWFLAKKIKVAARTLSWFFVNGEQISKPSNPGRLGKGSREMDTHASHGEVLPAPHSSNRNNKKLSGQVQALHTGHALFFPPFILIWARQEIFQRNKSVSSFTEAAGCQVSELCWRSGTGLQCRQAKRRGNSEGIGPKYVSWQDGSSRRRLRWQRERFRCSGQ